MSSDPASVILPGNFVFWHYEAAIDWISFVPSSLSGVQSKQRWLCHCFTQQISLVGAVCDI
jgi:hypothetical protein